MLLPSCLGADYDWITPILILDIFMLLNDLSKDVVAKALVSPQNLFQSVLNTPDCFTLQMSPIFSNLASKVNAVLMNLAFSFHCQFEMV